MEYSQTVKDDARKVHEYLKEHGWRQYAYADDSGRCCLVGAINRAVKGTISRGDVEAAIVEKVGACMFVEDFNDDPNTDFEAVEQVLQRIYNS